VTFFLSVFSGAMPQGMALSLSKRLFRQAEGIFQSFKKL